VIRRALQRRSGGDPAAIQRRSHVASGWIGDTRGMRSGVALGVVTAVAAGCGFHRAAAAGDAGAKDDAGPGCTSFASLLDTCPLAFTRDLTITGAANYNSATQTLTIGGTVAAIDVQVVTIGGDLVDVISARSVGVMGTNTTLRAIGPHALAIVANGQITIAVDAQIDVSDGGAGAQAACAPGAAVGTSDKNGAGGGGGGGFGADGGTGGAGDHDDGMPYKAGGAKGAAVALPPGLHGGCPGAKGGDGDSLGGAGGAGGGALYLVAANLIQLDSSAPINAAGSGGQGGLHDTGGDAGGGGGGAGGMIVLEAPHIMAMAATIAANGGGGGEGSESAGGAGAAGNPGTLSVTHADGGGGNSLQGADGGLGGSVEGPAGASPTMILDGGGGGGGGGVGFVRVVSPDAHIGAISPAASS
jgi:hypothetical protein